MFQCQKCKRWFPESLYAPANSAGNCQECALGMTPTMTPDEQEIQRLRTRLARAEWVVAAARMVARNIRRDDWVPAGLREMDEALAAWEGEEAEDGEG